MTIGLDGIFNFLFLLFTFDSIGNMIHPDISSPFFWIPFNVLIVLCLILLKKKYFNIYDLKLILFVRLFLVWCIISVIRGLFIAENYWEWKNLVQTAFTMLMPLFLYPSMNPKFVQHILHFWFKYALVLILFFIPLVYYSFFYGSYLSPILILLVFIGPLSLRWKLIVILYVSLVFYAGFESRSHLIRFSVAGLIGSLYYFRSYFVELVIKISHIVLLLLPIILLILGLLNIFNVFRMDGYIKGDYSVVSKNAGTTHKDSLLTDTRTFIYKETISSAIKNNYLLFGRTPAQGYDSISFGSELKWTLKTGKMQRFASEVGILNFLTWNGVIGMLLFTLVFVKATFLAIYKSQNIYIKLLSLFVTFRWAYSFVEEIPMVSLQYALLWIMIGMCYSPIFRNMNDDKFRQWIYSLLPKFIFR